MRFIAYLAMLAFVSVLITGGIAIAHAGQPDYCKSHAADYARANAEMRSVGSTVQTRCKP